ncbi:hypothetical protein [Streptomyces sp. CB00316]|uniref:hypothetical protein n=1 Tax=Streptomyces sp. CB00316 TaxID=1703932 RepID=UPI0011611AF4|nr:hypothetical protein [Streptomyces sp. CB00316]
MMIWVSEAVLTDFQQNLVIALAGAIVGVLGAMAIERMKSRREATKRLSWDADTRTAVISTDEAIRPLLQLSYNGVTVDDLSSVEFRVENTGNRVVQQQQLRFRFPEGTQVLEAAVSSRPEQELGVARCPEREESTGRPCSPLATSNAAKSLPSGSSLQVGMPATGRSYLTTQAGTSASMSAPPSAEGTTGNTCPLSSP